MKKLGYVALMIALLIPMFMVPIDVNAAGKTLRDLYNNLSKLQRELEDINNDKTLTENKINQIKQNIGNIDKEVIAIEKTILDIHKDIVMLNDDIVAKDKEIKELMKFFQLSTGENMYLEYAFGASSMTDFIYRLAVVEQLTKHNNKLIDDMNNMIVSQEKKSKELANHQENIIVKRKELSEEQFKLGDRVQLLYEDTRSLSDEIADAKATIKNYEKLGCKPNDLLEECSRINGDVSFSRPVSQGLITCGWLCYSGHRAIDIGGGIYGEPIYPTASGRVVGIIWGSTCGGNYVIIQHKINGKYYASRYMHMSKIYVSVNQEVTKDTIIGAVGGYAGGVDRCTTGPHLHFNVSSGIYAQDFWDFSVSAINPITIINFPPVGVWFGSRYGKY